MGHPRLRTHLKDRPGFKLAAYTSGIGTTPRKMKQKDSKSLRLLPFSILMLYILKKFH